MNEINVGQGRSDWSEAPRLLNVSDLGAYLALPVSTIYTWVSLGRIPGVVRLGRALRFDKAEIDRWVEANREEWHWS